MKIAVIHFNLTTESGDPRMALSIAQGLKKLGHTMVVYCAEFDAKACFPRLNNRLDIRIVPFVAPLSSARGAIGIFRKVFERIKQIKVYNDLVKRMAKEIDKDLDFIICQNDYSYKIGRAYKKRKPDTKVVWVMNNPPFFHSKKNSAFADMLSRGIAFFEKRSVRYYGRGVDWIVTCDEEARRLAETAGRPVKIVRTPIDVGYFYAPVKVNSADKKSITILGVGALSPQRRYEDMILAAALLRKKGHDARVILVCKDYWGDKRYREEFENFIRNSGVAQYIDARFRGATDREFLEAIRASDVMIAANNIKVWSMAALEAMAAGLPLVVSRVTNIAGVLHDENDALFVDVLRPDQIAEKVEILMKNPALYAKIASAGQKLVKDAMSIENCVQEILKPPAPLKIY